MLFIKMFTHIQKVCVDTNIIPSCQNHTNKLKQWPNCFTTGVIFYISKCLLELKSALILVLLFNELINLLGLVLSTLYRNDINTQV